MVGGRGYACAMSRTPGRRPDQPEDEDPLLAVNEVDLRDIGQSLIELGEQLRKVGQLTEKKALLERGVLYGDEFHELTPQEVEQEISETHLAMRHTLTGLRAFRRSYDYWERVIAEFALSRMHYTQRDTAKLLGVGVSTINRWAQNPLAVQDHS